VLSALYEALQNGEAALTQPPAIAGLGGIGKTQTAVEYAYRHKAKYKAVLWAVAESETTLTSSYSALALLLGLPEKDAAELELTVAAVMRWLEQNDDYLLILDNADDLNLARKFLPANPHGHIIFTTRSAVAGRHIRLIPLEKLSPEDGAQLLLNRVKSEAKPNSPEWGSATAISRELDGLPLALEQAAAYIEANFLSFDEYLELYEDEGVRLLAKHANPDDQEHSPVTVTFSLAFRKIAETNPAAADLLRLISFLAPDDIPEFIFTKNADELEGGLALVAGVQRDWTELVGKLGQASLIRRDADRQSLSIHRLVQAVLRAEISGADSREYIDCSIRCIGAGLSSVDFDSWPLCEVLVPHAVTILEFSQTAGVETVETARLLNQLGLFLASRTMPGDVEALYLRATAIWEKLAGPDDPNVATCLNNLALFYQGLHRFPEAEKLYLRSLAISENALGTEHPDTATSLNNLASLYEDQGRLDEAESLYLRALEISKRSLGVEHPDTATTLNNLAFLYHIQGRLAEAYTHYVQSLEIAEQVLGPKHPDVANSLSNLAYLKEEQGYLSDAEPLRLHALSIREEALGSDHPDVAKSLNNLAVLYLKMGRRREAEEICIRALSVAEKSLRSDHPLMQTIRKNVNLLCP
jgi:tetratricopeptide (TPR) repeat protein